MKRWINRAYRYGEARVATVALVSLGLGIRCPHCGSLHTRELSHFGSTSCKALYVCQRCPEPFDLFKAH